MDDLISRQAAIDAIVAQTIGYTVDEIKAECEENIFNENGYLGGLKDAIEAIEDMPSAQPTLYGYNIEHLELIARVLQKEDLPPERVVEVLTDVGKIVAIVKDEFEEALRKAVEQCMT